MRDRDRSATLAVLMIVAIGCASSGSHGAEPRSAPPTSIAATTTVAGVTSTTPGPTTTTSVSSPGPSTTSAGASTSVATTSQVCGSIPSPPTRYQHVVWIWMENHRWSEVLGNPSAAPYEASLAGQCGTATSYADVGSPSLPNYLGATSGATHGIADDAAPPAHALNVDNLFRQVRAAGGTERSYQEGMTAPCQLASAGRYAVKHNPAAYYTAPGDRDACRADDLPFTAFQADLQADLPTFSFVTPDLCHDTHDCGVSTGDAWLAATLPGVLASRAYRTGTTAVFVIWDEPSPMPIVIAAPSVRPRTVARTPLNHYSLLATTEEMLGLPGRLGAAAQAPSLRSLFNL